MAQQEGNQGNGRRTARAVQQDFGDSLGYAEEIIWDLLSQEQSDVLKKKLNELIRDPPPLDPRAVSTMSPAALEREERNRNKLIADNIKARQIIFDAVWEQRKYTNRQSLTALIYVLVVTDTDDPNRAEDSRTYSSHPVFRARRCITGSSGTSSDTSDCCNLFVDEIGRVYQNWEQYVATNELPAGVMVAPQRGIYSLVDNKVRLDKYVTPAGSPNARVLGALDTGSAIGGFAAVCVPIAALLTLPVSAPAMAVAGIVGLASAGYATARSGARLVDRSQHEQSINVTSREARGHWLGVIGGAVGLGAAGATTALTAATNAGREVGAVTQLTVNSMNISSIVVSGTGVANGVVDMILKYNDGDDITGMDVLQLSASLVLFTHSAYNFKLASTIINETATRNISGYRETLSNRQRRSFDKAVKETIRLRGNTRGRLDVIRSVNEVPSRQQFNDLYRINQNLNQEGVRYSFAPDGQGFLLNGEVQASAAEIRASVQHNQGPNVLGQVSQPIPSSHSASGRLETNGLNQVSRLIGPQPTAQPRREPSTYAAGVFALQLSSVVVGGVTFVLEKYGSNLFEHVINASSFEDLILGMSEHLGPDVFDFVLKLTATFMDTMLDDLTTVLKFYISSESVLFRILEQIRTKYRGLPYELVAEHTGNILAAVRRYYLLLNPNSYTGLLKKCPTCVGYFRISNL